MKGPVGESTRMNITLTQLVMNLAHLEDEIRHKVAADGGLDALITLAIQREANPKTHTVLLRTAFSLVNCFESLRKVGKKKWARVGRSVRTSQPPRSLYLLAAGLGDGGQAACFACVSSARGPA